MKSFPHHAPERMSGCYCVSAHKGSSRNKLNIKESQNDLFFRNKFDPIDMNWALNYWRKSCPIALFVEWLIAIYKKLFYLHFNFSSGSWRTDGVFGDVMWWWWWCPAKSGCELWCKWLKPVVNPLPIDPTLVKGDIRFEIADETLTAVPSWRLWWWWWLCRWSFELDWLVGKFPFDVLLLSEEPEPTKSWRHRPDVSDIWSNPFRSIIGSG